MSDDLDLGERAICYELQFRPERLREAAVQVERAILRFWGEGLDAKHITLRLYLLRNDHYIEPELELRPSKKGNLIDTSKLRARKKTKTEAAATRPAAAASPNSKRIT
jgi:hypothetical protein